MNDSICKDCRYRMNIWAESLREEYNGCGILLDDNFHEIHTLYLNEPTENEINEYLFNMFNIDSFGFGWITNCKMAFNDQPIVQNVTKCKNYTKQF